MEFMDQVQTFFDTIDGFLAAAVGVAAFVLAALKRGRTAMRLFADELVRGVETEQRRIEND